MPSADSIAKRIADMLSERKRLAGAIAEIDASLARVAGVLVDGRPAAPPGAGGRKRRRRRGRFAVSANDLVVAFVKANPGATTGEIKKHWTAEGRAGGADNTLSLLVKAKKLKRTALGKGIRGSRYSPA